MGWWPGTAALRDAGGRNWKSQRLGHAGGVDWLPRSCLLPGRKQTGLAAPWTCAPGFKCGSLSTGRCEHPEFSGAVAVQDYRSCSDLLGPARPCVSSGAPPLSPPHALHLLLHLPRPQSCKCSPSLLRRLRHLLIPFNHEKHHVSHVPPQLPGAGSVPGWDSGEGRLFVVLAPGPQNPQWKYPLVPSS